MKDEFTKKLKGLIENDIGEIIKLIKNNSKN